MNLPQALLVDDSEAVLAFERAALAGHFDVRTASNGREALATLAQGLPDVMVLDLSMPEMDGAQVLTHLRADPALHALPVVILSSETSREAECLQAGANVFLPKPVAADHLRVTLHAVLEAARQRQREGSLQLLPVSVGPHLFALPLEGVRQVLYQVALRALPGAPPFIPGWFELRGEPVFVLDLARRLRVSYLASPLNRQLVVVRRGETSLALSLDRVLDPEELPAAQVRRREQLGGSEHGVLPELCLAAANTSRGTLLVLDPAALLSPRLLRKLPESMRTLPASEEGK